MAPGENLARRRELVTAERQIRIANAVHNSSFYSGLLFLKGGPGGRQLRARVT